jgi:hypothetical protein
MKQIDLCLESFPHCDCYSTEDDFGYVKSWKEEQMKPKLFRFILNVSVSLHLSIDNFPSFIFISSISHLMKDFRSMDPIPIFQFLFFYPLQLSKEL